MQSTKKTLMETINLEKLTAEAIESIKGGGWIFQENQWIWIEDDPPTDDNDWSYNIKSKIK